jgi:hypothetical protein
VATFDKHLLFLKELFGSTFREAEDATFIQNVFQPYCMLPQLIRWNLIPIYKVVQK